MSTFLPERISLDNLPISLDASSTTGIQAVAMVLVGYWYKTSGILEKIPIDLKSMSPIKFVPPKSLSQKEIGNIMIYEHGHITDFLKFTEQNPLGLFALQYINESRFKYYIADRIATDIGQAVTKSDFWFEMKKEIHRLRNKTKKVKKVMET